MNRDRPSYRVYRPGIHDSTPPTALRVSAPPPPKARGATFLYLVAIATLITVASMSAIRFVRADRYAPSSAKPTAAPLPVVTAPVSVIDPATMPSVLVEAPDATPPPKPKVVHRWRRIPPAASASGEAPPPNPYPQ